MWDFVYIWYEMGFLLYDLYFDIAWPLSSHNHLVYCGGGNGYSACLHCLCSDFINFLWPFKTFKTAATLQ